MTGTHRCRKNSANKFGYGSRNCVSKRSVTLLYIFDDSNGLRQCTASPSEHLFDMARAGRKKRSILPPSSVGRINRASLHAARRLGTIPNTRSVALLWPNCASPFPSPVGRLQELRSRRRNGRAASGCAKRTRFRNVGVAVWSCPGNNNPQGRRRGVYRRSGCNFVSPKSA